MNVTFEELKGFFTHVLEFPRTLETQHSIITDVSNCVFSYINQIEELLQRYGMPTKNGTKEQISAWKLMRFKKQRLTDIYTSLQNKENWNVKLKII